MTWDFAEANPFSESTGNWMAMVDWTAKALENAPAANSARIYQRDAVALVGEAGRVLVSTDPPYYDNIGYADLSDFFYVWLRRNLRDVWPDELSTLLSPKAEELIASPFRAGSRSAANEHFESGMAAVFGEVAKAQDARFPVSIFYAFKQAETEAGGVSSTGWEVFLDALLRAGLSVDATWPIRTELSNRPVASGTAALASSIVLSCRPRSVDAALASTGEFRAALREELPAAIRVMQKGAIAPVDLAQSAIGPGMAVFSRFSKVVEGDGSSMSVRRALQIINEVLDEVVSEEETEFDADTRWAVTWYRQFGLNPGPYGTAETLSKAKNTSVAGVVEAGLAASRDGKVWLLGRGGLNPDWDPGVDRRSTVWEATQHLLRLLEDSESGAAGLLRQLGGTGERARQLAYLLFRVAEQKGWAQEAVAYDSLARAWPELQRLARTETTPGQLTLEG
jgi:putative DNA methylase